MKALLFIILIGCYNSNLQAQENNFGAVHLHFGTLVAYNTYSIGYESPDVFPKRDKLALYGNFSVGGWSANFSQPNTGFQSKLGGTMLLGSNSHHLELGLGTTFHFDRGLKGQPVVYIDALLNSFIGYRYQKKDRRLLFKAGIGWYEALQIGVGFKL